MTALNEKLIFEKLAKFNYSKEIRSILSLLEEHSKQIVFIKDHFNVSNFLFIPETIDGSNKPEATMFACFGIDTNSSTPNILEEISSSMITEPLHILEAIGDFLANQEGPFYVEIGFDSSKPTAEDLFKVHLMLRSGTFKNIQEAIANVKRFPEWYDALFSMEIELAKQYEKKMEITEKKLLNYLAADIIRHIDEAYDNGDIEIAAIHRKKLRIIVKEIKSFEHCKKSRT